MIKVLRLTAEVSILGPRSRSDRISGSESKDQRPNRVKTVYPIPGLRGTILNHRPQSDTVSLDTPQLERFTLGRHTSHTNPTRKRGDRPGVHRGHPGLSLSKRDDHGLAQALPSLARRVSMMTFQTAVCATRM